VRAEESDIDTGRGAPPGALAMVLPRTRIRLVQTEADAASLQSSRALEYQSPRRSPRAVLKPVRGGFKLPGRLSTALGEVMEMLIATSGTLVVVIILLVMAMMMRTIRALLHR
jgi:hypothetical protein